jgi:hypothetical protein
LKENEPATTLSGFFRPLLKFYPARIWGDDPILAYMTLIELFFLIYSPCGPKFLPGIEDILLYVDRFASLDLHHADAAVLDLIPISIDRLGLLLNDKDVVPRQIKQV